MTPFPSRSGRLLIATASIAGLLLTAACSSNDSGNNDATTETAASSAASTETDAEQAPAQPSINPSSAAGLALPPGDGPANTAVGTSGGIEAARENIASARKTLTKLDFDNEDCLAALSASLMVDIPIDEDVAFVAALPKDADQTEDQSAIQRPYVLTIINSNYAPLVDATPYDKCPAGATGAVKLTFSAEPAPEVEGVDQGIILTRTMDGVLKAGEPPRLTAFQSYRGLANGKAFAVEKITANEGLEMLPEERATLEAIYTEQAERIVSQQQ